MEYQAIYKCRLCEKTFASCYTGKNIAWANMMSILGLQEIEKTIYGNTISKQDLHFCDDDSMGIADFQGFKAVEE